MHSFLSVCDKSALKKYIVIKFRTRVHTVTTFSKQYRHPFKNSVSKKYMFKAFYRNSQQ